MGSSGISGAEDQQGSKMVLWVTIRNPPADLWSRFLLIPTGPSSTWRKKWTERHASFGTINKQQHVPQQARICRRCEGTCWPRADLLETGPWWRKPEVLRARQLFYHFRDSRR